MAIFKRMTKEEMKEQGLTHKGIMFGFCPVYLGDLDSEGPNVVVRNWFPDWLFDLGYFLDSATRMTLPFNDEDPFKILVTGEIDYE
ncbi:hypothetical protein [Oligella urethralis]|uniref:Uncharacterized protein n=1 Tax=Oligella urethralis TaxID=90245 RepID=A0A2X1ULP9_9BURK|nr:hypothetical protein [Oligella urethralis]SPY08069.1 Uncharacterised protein [Oligella urethralis]